MADSSVSKTTQPLRASADGDKRALESLIPTVYRKLRRLAEHCLKNKRLERTLQVSDLVHEAYIHLADLSRLNWQHREHFFAVSARLMRRILLNGVRKRMAGKGGKRAQGIDVELAPECLQSGRPGIVALDDALNELPRMAQVAGVSVETVMRDWKVAKVWLLKELTAA